MIAMRLKSIAWLAVALATMGMTREQLPSGLAPDHDEAPIWGIMKAGTRFQVDRAKGLYVASFDKTMKASEGQRFTISGYILPLDAGRNFTHFVITRRNTGCPFCPPNEMGEAVEVFSRKPIAYSTEEVTFVGRLRLISSSTDGLFYRLEDASGS